MKFQTHETGSTNLPIDLNSLLQHADSPTAIILSLAILLWILRPVMLQNKSNKK